MYTGVEFLIRQLLFFGCDFRLKKGDVFLLFSSIFCMICWTPNTVSEVITSHFSSETEITKNKTGASIYRRISSIAHTRYDVVAGFLFSEIFVVVVVAVVFIVVVIVVVWILILTIRHWHRYITGRIVIRRVPVPELLVDLTMETKNKK